MMLHLTIFYSLLLVVGVVLVSWLVWQKHHGKSKIRR